MHKGRPESRPLRRGSIAPGLGAWGVALAAAALLGARPGSPAQPTAGPPIISQLTDAPDTQTGSLDVVGAAIAQVGPESLQLSMRLREPVPLNPGPGSGVTYIWRLDTDRNPQTGQPGSRVGSEYNVRVAFHQGEWGGHVDNLRPNAPGGGQCAVFVSGASVTLRLSLNQIGGAAAFNWDAASFAESGGRHVPGDSADGAATTTLAPAGTAPGAFPQIYLAPSFVRLAEGRASAPLTAVAYNASGERQPLGGRRVEYFVTRPSAVVATATGVAATASGFGPARVIARVDGILSEPAGVSVGSVGLLPPVLHLSLPGNPTGRVAIQLRSARGQSMPLTGRSVKFESLEPTVVTISAAGTVTGRQPRRHGPVGAIVDGVHSANNCLVKVLDRGFSMPAPRAFAGKYVTFWLPPDFSIIPSKETLAQMMEKYDGIGTADAVYQLQEELTGCLPSRGGRQHITAVGGEDEASRVCGVSGNPFLIGLNLADPARNCIQLHPNGEPHFGVWFHEMGHNATLASRSFNEALGPGLGLDLPSSITFVEGLATLAGLYAKQRLLTGPGHFGLREATLACLRDPNVYGSQSFDRRIQVADLEKYEKAGARYTSIDANILDGMLFILAEKHGWEPFPRFFDALLPPDEPPPLVVDTEAKRATFFVAAMSNAFQRDLRPEFAKRWGFPVDDGLYQQLLPVVRRRAERGRLLRGGVTSAGVEKKEASL